MAEETRQTGKQKRVVVTFEDCEKAGRGDKKEIAIYHEICRIGGFGSIGNDFHGGYPALDVSSLDDAKLAEIEKILSGK